MAINLNDLLIFLVVFIGISLLAIVCIMLIIAVNRLNKMLKKVGKILDDNSDNIDKTMKKALVLAEHWDETSQSLKVAANKTETTVTAVNGFLTGTTHGTDVNTVQSIVTIVESALQVVLGHYANRD
jgi:ABC-type transporter Mla subunit MlaD